MLDDRRAGQARVSTAQLRPHVRMAQRQAADMRLVDHGLVIGRARRPVVGPVEVRVDHHVARHVRGAVGVAQRSAGHPGGTRTASHASAAGPRPPCRRDQAAAWPGCTGARDADRRGRARGRRTAVPGPISGRWQCQTKPSTSVSGILECSRAHRGRIGTAQPARRPRRTGRSSCPTRPRWRPADMRPPARCASADLTGKSADVTGREPGRDPGRPAGPRTGWLARRPSARPAGWRRRRRRPGRARAWPAAPPAARR